MNIYVGRSSSLNYRNGLYHPIKESSLTEEHNIVFPHENSDEVFNSKEFIEGECDLFIAEVSKDSTGLGIELGWAEVYDVPVLAICKKNSKPSSSISVVADEIKEYSSNSELISLIEHKTKIRNEEGLK